MKTAYNLVKTKFTKIQDLNYNGKHILRVLSGVKQNTQLIYLKGTGISQVIGGREIYSSQDSPEIRNSLAKERRVGFQITYLSI